MNNGAVIPSIGLGSFDGFSHSEAELAAFRESIKVALAAGYRLIDCADVYNNEEVIGEALEETFAKGDVKRSQVCGKRKKRKKGKRKEEKGKEKEKEKGKNEKNEKKKGKGRRKKE